MKQVVVHPGKGPEYSWSSDHVFVKTSGEMTDGRVTMVEDRLKAGFHLARHHHKKTTEVFYILEGEVVFKFDDVTVTASPGMVINIPPMIRHDVRCDDGAKLLTIFSPGGFDHYLLTLANLTAEQYDDEAFMTALARRYDIWGD